MSPVVEDDRNDNAILNLYHEKAGILDGEADTEVDLASYAYQIWKNAITADPSLQKTIPDLPPVIYATRAHDPTNKQPGGVLVYLRTAEGNDALAWIDKNGTAVTESQFAILQAVVEITSHDGPIPNAKIRAAVHKQVAKQHHENLLIFLDRHRTQSLWYWVKREGSKTYSREHLYVQGQPGDLFLSKLSAMVFDISELDEAGRIPVVEVAGRLKEALDVEQVTKKFYREFSEQHVVFLEFIRRIANERDRRWYTSVLLNRLMFIYFLQRKGFLDNQNLAQRRFVWVNSAHFLGLPAGR
jgi:hypothetical protein